jgi:histidyl-tRNA synthetase
MEKETVKGARDFVGEDALKREKIKEIITSKFKKYGFLPTETPIIEYEEFVKGDNLEDEAISDIFRLQDKGQRKLALRYELTFQLKRLAQQKKLPFRRYQIGEVFRDEPIGANRFRQFTQCDIDIVGSTIRDEAEILSAISEILKELKIGVTIFINNRKLLNEILEEQGITEAEDKVRIIREIDKIDKISEQEFKKNLEGYDAQKMLEIFKKPESYFEKYKAYEEIRELKKYCGFYGVRVKFLPTLARGLSYYTGSIFEIKTAKIKETITAGGSYLINNIQSTGISMGLNRLSSLAKLNVNGVKCIIISISKDRETAKLAAKLRDEGISCFIMEKISKALEYADSEKIPYVIFVGKEEIKKKKLKLRDMKTGKETVAAISDIIRKLK